MKITDILSPVNQLAEKKVNNGLNGNDKVNKFKHLLERNINADQEYKRSVNVNNKRPVDKKLMDVCIEMESIFVSRMLKEMRNTVPKQKLIDGGYAEKIFEDMLYDDYALNISKTSNLGLGRMLYNELSRI